jgi:hypothetical protein
VAQCTLLYPGLLGPDVPLHELPRQEWPDKTRLPNLSLLLNRGKLEAIAKHSLEQQILTALGYVIAAGDELPIAALRQSDTITGDMPVWCLDPVQVQLDRELAYLSAPELLNLSETEARELITTLNEYFADVLHIHYHSPLHWLVQTRLQVSTRTPTESILQDISRMMPTGTDAQRWRSLVTEIQMLLHSHPVNTVRTQAGKLPVNSVWLWGGGAIETTKADIDVVYANDAMTALAAARNRIMYAELPHHIDAAIIDGQSVLLVISDQLPAIQQKDVYAWLAALNQLEQTVLSPLLALLRNDKLEQLVLQSDTLRLTLTKQDLAKWWRRRKSIEARILALRESYGH